MRWWHTTACGTDGKTKLLMRRTNRRYRAGTLALVDIILRQQQPLTVAAGASTGHETKSLN
jgi:hypothetical protein